MKNKIYRALTSVSNPANWLIEALGGKPSKTGVKVSIDTSIGLAPVYYAINKISGHMAQMPVNVERISKSGSREYLRNNTYRLLNKSPNDIMTPFTLREIMMVHALIAGNGRAYIERNSNGTPIGLIPVMPQSCQTALVDGKKWHLVSPYAGTTNDALPARIMDGGYYKVPDRDMIHIMNTSYNGLWGMHVIEIAKDVFGLTQAGQEGAAVSIANSGRPSIILEAPQGMFRGDKDAKMFLDNFNKAQQGLDNSGKAALLRDGIIAKQSPLNPIDAQFLQQRNFQREEIALLFGLESIMGDNSGQTYRSITERNTAYINNCLGRWMKKWTEEIDEKLISFPSIESSFDPSMLMKGDLNSIADYTGKLSLQGIATQNELRSLNGLNPVDGGDDFITAGIKESERQSNAEAQREAAEAAQENNNEPNEDNEDDNEEN